MVRGGKKIKLVTSPVWMCNTARGWVNKKWSPLNMRCPWTGNNPQLLQMSCTEAKCRKAWLVRQAALQCEIYTYVKKVVSENSKDVQQTFPGERKVNNDNKKMPRMVQEEQRMLMLARLLVEIKGWSKHCLLGTACNINHVARKWRQ